MEQVRSVKFYKKKTHHRKTKNLKYLATNTKKKKYTYVYTKKTGAIRGHVFHPDKNFYTIAQTTAYFFLPKTSKLWMEII